MSVIITTNTNLDDIKNIVRDTDTQAILDAMSFTADGSNRLGFVWDGNLGSWDGGIAAMALSVFNAIDISDTGWTSTGFSKLLPAGTSNVTVPDDDLGASLPADVLLKVTGSGFNVLPNGQLDTHDGDWVLSGGTIRVFKPGADSAHPLALPASGALPSDTAALITLNANVTSKNDEISSFNVSSVSYKFEDGSTVSLSGPVTYTSAKGFSAPQGLTAKFHLLVPDYLSDPDGVGGDDPVDHPAHFIDLQVTTGAAILNADGTTGSATITKISLDDGEGHSVTVTGLSATETGLKNAIENRTGSLMDALLDYFGSSASDTIVSSAVSTDLEDLDSVENLTLSNTKVNGVLTAVSGFGNDGKNTITGNDNANVLDGRGGADKLAGGKGDDVYYVDDVKDVVTEAANAGTDLVYASVSYTLSANVENLTLTGSDNLDATGNALGNLLTGNSGENQLDGGVGADTLAGGDGNDTYVVDNAQDKVIEADNEGRDNILASISIDLTSANFAGQSIESVMLTGKAALNATGNGLDNTLSGNAGANKLSGGDGDDQLIGDAGNDILDGGAGADTMMGETGNDVYVIDDVNDTVIEADKGGTDTIESSVLNVDLSSRLYVENATLLGALDLNATGNDQANVITGNAGKNKLDGGAGVDTLIGGAGDDTYTVDLVAVAGVAKLQDTITEGLAAGNDTVVLRVAGDLGLTKATTLTLGANLENLDASDTGSNKLNLTGNALGNTLTGNDADNVLNGGVGVDTLIGGAGNDTYIIDNLGDIVTEDIGGGADTVMTSVAIKQAFDNVETYVFTGKGNWTFQGNDLGDSITGAAGADQLTGGDDDDVLDGGVGADILTGGDGNDIYVVDNAKDQVIEAANEGTDTIRSSIAIDLTSTNFTGQSIENVELSGTAALNVTGNDLQNKLTGNAGANKLSGGDGDDELVGNAGNDILDGGVGADKMTGGAGNDVYVVDDMSDQVIEADNGGIDTIQSSVLGINLAPFQFIENATLLGNSDHDATGNGQANLLTGNAGNNKLDGGAGVDTLIGGAGNDTYTVDLVAVAGVAKLQDTVIESIAGAAGGIDTLALRATGDLGLTKATTLTLGANLENLNASNTNSNKLNLTGNALANTLTGNDADNVLNGGVGVDTLIGGAGNDTYIVDNLGDIVTEDIGGGADTVMTSVAIKQAFDNVETYVFTGKGNWIFQGNDLGDSITGGAGADQLTGGDDDDVLDGGVGADILTGGDGDDIYVVDNAKDQVIEVDGKGTDTIRSSISIDLTSTNFTGQSIENVELSGTAALNITGNGLENKLTGNAGANKLSGGAGDDELIGNAGNDILDGGVGADKMTGGIGNDLYIIDDAGDQVIEADNQGTDTIQSSTQSIDLRDFDFVENLTLTGTSNLDGKGSEVANVITGNAGDNKLDGLAGVDTLIGGAGNDTYTVDLVVVSGVAKLQDTVIESLAGAAGGTDTLVLRAIADLGLTKASTLTLGVNLENLDASNTGVNKLNLTGNALANILTGNDADNVLSGGAGNDTLIGGVGNDKLDGGAGIDTVDYSDGGAAVTVDLQNGLASDDGDGGHDQLVSIENVRGSAFDDTLIGGTGDNSFEGLGGSDTFGFKLGAIFGHDTILDFDGTTDKLQFTNVTDHDNNGVDLNDLTAAISKITDAGAGGAVTVSFTNGSSIVFEHAGTAGSTITSITQLVSNSNQISVS